MYFYQQNDFSDYGIDWGGSVPSPTNEDVDLPETWSPIDPERMQSLSRFYLPQGASINHVINLFICIVEHINELLTLQLPM